MDGRELADRLQQSRPQMKVIFMSGYSGNVVVHHGVLDEGVTFLQKPIMPDPFLRSVRVQCQVIGSTIVCFVHITLASNGSSVPHRYRVPGATAVCVA
jgi:CheY-like chemotaxis protein